MFLSELKYLLKINNSINNCNLLFPDSVFSKIFQWNSTFKAQSLKHMFYKNFKIFILISKGDMYSEGSHEEPGNLSNFHKCP